MKKYILLRSLVALLFVHDISASNDQPLQINGDNFKITIVGNMNESYTIKPEMPFNTELVKANIYGVLEEIIKNFYSSGEYLVPTLYAMCQEERARVCTEEDITSPVNLLLCPNVVPIRYSDLVQYLQPNNQYLQPNIICFYECDGWFNFRTYFFVNCIMPFLTIICSSDIVTLNSVAQNENIFKIDKIADYLKKVYYGISEPRSKKVVLLPVRNKYLIENHYYRLSLKKQSDLAGIFEKKR